MTKQQEIDKRKNEKRPDRVGIRVYNYSGRYFGEPPLPKLKSLNFDTKILKTHRKDWNKFYFVRCKFDGELKILVLSFAPNGVDRLSCQFLNTWDPKASVVHQ